jgi:hypothetical protein
LIDVLLLGRGNYRALFPATNGYRRRLYDGRAAGEDPS